ncbi:hypothetical protein [Nocardiopsis sp. EMB25]|nr:hypothetical protein [Nocardiopsis sp. EMB25]
MRTAHAIHGSARWVLACHRDQLGDVLLHLHRTQVGLNQPRL